MAIKTILLISAISAEYRQSRHAAKVVLVRDQATTEILKKKSDFGQVHVDLSGGHLKIVSQQ